MNSVQTLLLVQRWMQECNRDHKASCSSRHKEPLTRKYPPMPHRILHIGSDASGVIKLSEDNTDDAPYICLSYCWGKEKNHVQTNSKTKGQFERGIPIGGLPQLFQDCIHVARFFNISYLWIDTLCIVQDDKDDWEVEARDMKRVYSNSWLTIAATAASGPQESMFRERTTAKYQVHDGFFHTQTTRHFPEWAGGDLDGVFPLLKRGWVYQERILSPRVLHFGPDEIIWECFARRRCECGQISHVPNEISKRELFDLTHRPKSVSKATMQIFWQNIVTQYTALALSQPTDRLHALHGVLEGIGNARQKVYKDNYVAGLWRQSLAFDLLWSAVGDGRKRLVSPASGQAQRAPSWSWASVDFPIEYPRSMHHAWCEERKQECQVSLECDWYSTLRSDTVGKMGIKLVGKSLEPGSGFSGRFSPDYHDGPRIEDLYICLVASDNLRYWGLALEASGQFFSRAGIVMSIGMDKSHWVERSYIVR